MKVIFLDIDGVLNSKETFIKRKEIYKKTGKHILEIDEEIVKRLSKIIEHTSAKIVLSSTWRIYFKREDSKIIPINDKGIELNNLLKKHNIELFDMTPILYHDRKLEIAYWIRHNSYIDSFIIIDDNIEDLETFNDRVIKTSFEMGLMEEDINKAVVLLNNKKAEHIENNHKVKYKRNIN